MVVTASGPGGRNAEGRKPTSTSGSDCYVCRDCQSLIEHIIHQPVHTLNPDRDHHHHHHQSSSGQHVSLPWFQKKTNEENLKFVSLNYFAFHHFSQYAQRSLVIIRKKKTQTKHTTHRKKHSITTSWNFHLFSFLLFFIILFFSNQLEQLCKRQDQVKSNRNEHFPRSHWKCATTPPVFCF